MPLLNLMLQLVLSQILLLDYLYVCYPWDDDGMYVIMDSSTLFFSGYQSFLRYFLAL